VRNGKGSEQRPVIDFKLLKYVVQVHFDSAIRNIQPARNRLI
jgi:hypothetical protein